MKKKYNLFTKIGAYAAILLGLTTTQVNAQLTGTINIPGGYVDLATAITDLNTQGVGAGGVVLNLLAPETAPTGGYSITATGTSVNPIVLLGNANVITAPTPQAPGSQNDAIFKIIGADYVTISGFNMQENAANTTTVVNNMTEFGVSLTYSTATDGAQNVSITSNTITLNRMYPNTFGIYSNNTHNSTVYTTANNATSPMGANSGLTITGNNISNVNIGIVVIGANAAANFNNGLVIGGSAANGNTIADFGTTSSISGYSNVSGSVNGILVRNTDNYTISHNNIASSNGGHILGTIRGVFVPAFSAAPTIVANNAITNNTVSIRSGAAISGISGIVVEATTGTATSSLSISNNNFNTFGHTVAGSAAIFLINNLLPCVSTEINGNTFTNISVNTTGNFTFISNSPTRPANALITVNSNSVIGTFDKTGAGGTVVGYVNFGSSPASVTEVNNNNNFSNLTVTGATNLFIWRSADGGPPGSKKTISNNVFNNIIAGTGSTAVLYASYSDNSVFTNNVSNNQISNISSNGPITGVFSDDGNQNIINNIIHGLSSTGSSAVIGINIAGGTAQNVLKNKIYDLTSSNTGSSVFGINASAGATNTIANNVIGSLNTPSVSAVNALIGINITGGTNTNVFYNTVRLDGVSSGANFGSSALSTAATLVDVRNNILVNNSVPNGTGISVAHRRSAAALTNYATTSNNNLYYAGVPSATTAIYFDGTTVQQTLANFKAFVGPTREAASVTENPTFASLVGANANFLNFNPATSTQAESGAVNIAGFTDDYNNTVRQGNVGYAGTGSAPDIGAFEFEGAPLDLNPPTIVYTPLFGTCSTSGSVLTATITDASGVPTVGAGLPVLYWTVNAGTYTASVGAFTSANQYTFAFGSGVTQGDVVSYYIVAQDNATTPNVAAFPSAGTSSLTANPPASATVPTTPSSYLIQSSLSGTFAVGAAGTYTTLTAAVNAYNTSCLTGPVVFELTDATYSTNETFPILINNNSFASNVNTLLIKPAAANSPTITGNALHLIKYNGADFVTIDGSNNGTNSRDLTIQSTNTSTGTVVWIGNATLSDAVSNVALRNTNIIGNSNTTTLGGLLIGSGITYTSASDIPNNNISIINNLITRTQNGIFASGNAASRDLNWLFQNNTIGAALDADKPWRALLVQNAQSYTVTGNEVNGILFTGTAPAFGVVIGANSLNAVITKNKITNVKNTNTGGYGAYGIQLNTVGANSNILISNNFISDVAGYGWTTAGSDNGNGMYIVNGGGYKIYNNSVHLNTDQTLAGSITAGVFVTTTFTTVGGIDLRNNIIANSQTVGTNRYAIYSAAPNTVFSNINFNNYSSTGPNLAFIGSNRANLAALVTGFGGNANSTTVTPVFTSTSDLHLPIATNAALLDLGTVLADVTDDIDNQSRSTTPDMGADEFGDLPPTPPAPTQSTVTPSCVNGTELTVTGTPPTDVTWYWQTVATGTSTAFPASTPYTVTVNGDYFVRALNTVLNIWSTNSSSIAVTNIPVAPTPPTPVAAANPACDNTTLSAPTATGTLEYFWQGTNATGTSTVQSATSDFSVNATGTYYIAAFDNATSCWSSTNGLAVTINTVSPPLTSGTSTICTGATIATVTAEGPGGPALTQSVSVTTNYTLTTDGSTVIPVSVVLPPNATVVSSQLVFENVNTIGGLAGIWADEVGATIAGAINMPTTQITTAVGNAINATFSLTVPNLPNNGGSFDVTIEDLFGAGSTIIFGQIKFVVNYTTPTYTNITWWDANASGTQIGANSPFDVLGTSVLPNSTTPGTYTVFAQGEDGGCVSARTPVVLVLNPTPTASITTPNASICQGSSTNLFSGGSITSYTWAPAAGLPNPNAFGISVTPTTTTTYTLSGSNLGCVATATLEVTVNALPTVTANATATAAICGGTTESLFATGSASNYTWSPAGGNGSTASVTPTVTTTYTLTGSDGTCSRTSTVTVNVITAPTLSVASTSSLICLGATSDATLTASGTASTYTWLPTNDNTSTVVVTPTISTTYTVTGENTGCTTTETITVTVANAPSLTAVTLGGSAICAGNSGTLSAAGSATSFTWIPVGGNGPTAVVTPTANETYTVIGEADGCSAEATVSLSVVQIPTVTASASNVTICNGETSVLTANSSATSYTWSSGANTVSTTVTPTTTTVYTVTVSDSGCEAQADVTVNVNACTSIKEEVAKNIELYPNPTNGLLHVVIPEELISQSVIELYDGLGKLVMREVLTKQDNKLYINKLEEGMYFYKITSDTKEVRLGKVIKF